MYRFLLTPRWIAFHLLVIAGIVLMINLGFWQLRRLDERQAFNAQVAARIDVPPASLDDVLTGADPDDVEWRSVMATGAYLPEEELRVVNRSQGGFAGDIVVTPLQLEDGRILFVERGFVPLGAEAAPPPSGPVEVIGRLRPSQERRRGQLSDPSTGELTEVQRLDVERLARQVPGQPVPMYVELTSSDPVEAGPYPQPLDRARARRRPPPLLRRAVVHLLRRRGRRLGARRAQVGQRPANGFTTRRRRTDRGARRSSAAIVRVTCAGEASRRRYGAQRVHRQLEEGVEERRQLTGVEPQEDLEAVAVQAPGGPHRRRPHGRGHRIRATSSGGDRRGHAWGGPHRRGDGESGGRVDVPGSRAEPHDREAPRRERTVQRDHDSLDRAARCR